MDLSVDKTAFEESSADDKATVLSILSKINYIDEDTVFVPEDGAPGPIDFNADHGHMIARPFNSPTFMNGKSVENLGLNLSMDGMKGYLCDIAAATALAACVAGTQGVGLAFCTAVATAGKQACKNKFD